MKSMQQFIYLAGIGQIGLVMGSLAIPRLLNWRQELLKIQPLLRQMFWVYAAYIVVINLCFGLISVFDFRELTNGSGLATIIDGFIALYWVSRVFIQFFYFDRANFPSGKWYAAGEAALVALFIFLSAVYGAAFYVNYRQI